MKRKILTLTMSIFSALMAITALFWFAGETRAAVNKDLEGLAITTIQPNTAPNDVDTPIVIQGTGFTATISGTEVITAPTIYLGETELADVLWGSTTTLSATIPWGLIPDIYSLTVVNPDGISVTLENAITVTDGFDEFLTGGPYGGFAVQLKLKPGDSTSIYALMEGVGLFMSENAGENWKQLQTHDMPIQLDFDGQNPNILYFGADAGFLNRSDDNGENWVNLVDDFHTQQGCFRSYPVAHPSQQGQVYFGMGSCGTDFEPGEGGVYYSTNYGGDWSARNSGLTDRDIQSLAIHPITPTILMAGTNDGDLFYTTDGGDSWIWSTQLTDTVSQLYFNPHKPLEAWAMTMSGVENRGFLYRSTNLTDWTANPKPNGPDPAQMAFLPGAVWLASTGLFSSTNDGATWNELNGPNHPDTSLAIPPDNPQTIFVGTSFGVEKSTDGSLSWQEINEGLAALVPSSIAISSSNLDTVYVRAGRGIYRSQNGGNSWSLLDYGLDDYPPGNTIASDHFLSTQLYLSTGVCEDQFCVITSPDEGLTWQVVTSTLPVTYAGWQCSSHAIAPSPHISGMVLASGWLVQTGSDDDKGIFYRSADYGASWEAITTPISISPIKEIVYDAFDPNLIYAATYQSGFWRSTDGGTTWENVVIPAAQDPGFVEDITIHPNEPDKVLIRTGGPELWVSGDRGDTWESLAFVFGVDLIVSPPIPGQLAYSLYSGCSNLCRSTDDGQSWVTLAGTPEATILSAASDGERSVLYIGTPGGLVTGAGGQAVTNTPQNQSSIFGGGVYRLTTLLPDNWLYLPIVGR